MTAHHRFQLVVLATAVMVLLVRPDVMLFVAAVLLLVGLALQIRAHPHHHERHA